MRGNTWLILGFVVIFVILGSAVTLFHTWKQAEEMELQIEIDPKTE